MCGEARYRFDSLGRKSSRKSFSSCSIADHLQLKFGCRNIAKIMQDVGGEAKTVLTDIKDTALWANWQTTREKDTDVKIGLGMNTDGMYIYIYILM